MDTNENLSPNLDSSPELIELQAKIDTMFDELAREFQIRFEHAKLKCIINTQLQPPKSRKVIRTL